MQKCVTAALFLLLAGCVSRAPPLLDSGPPSAGFARTALSDGAPDVALNVATNILGSRPYDEEALLIQADALATLGRTREAEASYRSVLQRDPGSPAANRGLGRALLATDPAAAEALFQQIAARDPRDIAALNDLGIARDLQGRHADAQTAYRQALAASPDLPAATANLALSLSLSGHAAEAMQMLRPLAGEPNAAPRLRFDLAAVETMAGNRQEAAALLAGDMQSDKLQDALDGFAALSPAPAADPPAPAAAGQ
jgi:Flp pilus assembly protein TadD